MREQTVHVALEGSVLSDFTLIFNFILGDWIKPCSEGGSFRDSIAGANFSPGSCFQTYTVVLCISNGMKKVKKKAKNLT